MRSIWCLVILGFLNKEEAKRRLAPTVPNLSDIRIQILPGIEINSGSLGAMGWRWGSEWRWRRKWMERITVPMMVLGDGEMAEGSNYEAMMAAGQYRLDHLCATVDLNGLQISGTTDEVMSTADLGKKFEDFGWNVIHVPDGNDCSQLLDAYELAKKMKGKPTAVIAHTVKGRGVSFMENQKGWHHGVMSEEQYAQAVKEIEEVLA